MDGILWALIILWFAQGWYLNTRLALVHEKLDKILESTRSTQFLD